MDKEERQEILARWKQDNPEPTTADLISLLQQIGRPPNVVPEDFDPTRIRCACNKNVTCDNAKLVDTGHLHAVEPVCPPCRSDYNGMARLVCVPCAAVIGWITPQTDPNGFKIEADKFYHIPGCPVCTPDLERTDIIEMMVYYDSLGIPYEKQMFKEDE
jgi:hypothetical protein